MPIYHSLGSFPKKRHRLPSPGRRAVRGRTDGSRGVRRNLVAPLPHVPADHGQVRAEASTCGGRRHGHVAPPSPFPDGACGKGVEAPRSIAFRSCSTRTSPCSTCGARRDRRALLSELAVGRSRVRRRGSGVLETVFGDLPYVQGDYVVIHRNILHRWKLDTGKARRSSCCSSLVVTCGGPSGTATSSASSSRERPSASATSAGRASPDARRERRLPYLVKQYDAINELILDHHPFDVVGWDGYFYPWIFSIHDFEPIVRRIHQPLPGPSDLPGRRVRDLLVLPSTVRFRSAGRPGSLQLQQRGLGRGAVLRVE